jgi:diguanylate cyclase (GGDEF)-like protein
MDSWTVAGAQAGHYTNPSAWKLVLQVAIVACLGIALTVGMVQLQRHNVEEDSRVVIRQTVSTTAERASRSLGHLNGSLGAVTGLLAIQKDISEGEFRAFVRRTVPDRPDIQAMEYAPLVRREQRSKIEERLAAAGHPPEIRDPTPDGLAVAPERRQYLPILFAYPRARNQQAYGLDVLYRPGNREPVLAARDKGNTQIGQLPKTAQDDQLALVLYTPVYETGPQPTTVEERRERWAGIAVGVLRLPDLMQSAMTDRAEKTTSLALFNDRGPSTELLWTNDPSVTAGGSRDWSTSSTVTLTEGRDLRLVGAPTPGLRDEQGAWRPWAALISGLLITALLCTVVWKWMDARRVQRIADDLQQATNRLRFLAERDPLTGLPHRDGLRSWFDEWTRRNPQRSLALLFIDLDGFKEVNTAWGHPTGDMVLHQIGQRLGVLTGDPDGTIARLGGDEFVVARAMDRGSLEGLTTMVFTLINEPLPIGDRDVQFTSSIGISVWPEDGATLDAQLVNADLAVRAAKNTKGDSVVRFDPVMAAHGAARRQLSRALRVALRAPDEHFFLEYQPQVDMRTGTLVAAEALIRWRDSTGRSISPMDFIPLAQEQGLMPLLGRWVLDQACQAVAAWRETCEAVVAVNVDTQQLEGDFAGMLSTILHRRGVEPDWLVIEVTEGAAMGLEAQRELDRVRALGVEVSIDDFGTGFSSLSRLADLPATQLKIDRAFVTGLGVSHESLEIVRTVVALSQALGLDTLAEGVETPMQAQILLREGVSLAQGFLFSRPISKHACSQMWLTGVGMPASLVTG